MMIEDNKINIGDTVYNLILGKLVFDGYKQTVRALLEELQWKKKEVDIESSDRLSLLVSSAVSPVVDRKRKRDDSENTQKKKASIGETPPSPSQEKVSPKYQATPKVLSEEAFRDRITCEMCPKKFSREATYRRHLKTHTDSTIGKNVAKVKVVSTQIENPKNSTVEEFQLTLELDKIKVEHSQESATVDRENEINLLNNQDNETSIMDSNKETESTSMGVSKTSKPSVVQKHNSIQKVCKICNEKFKLLKYLKTHMRNKHPDVLYKPYKCRKCDQTFENTFKRYKHESADHEGLHQKQLKPVCDFCGVSLVASALADHIRAFHTGIKPFKCKFCDKRFVKGSHLKRHHRVHTGEKPYRCEHCNKFFADNSGLINHKAREHSSKEENIHECSVCLKIYRSVADLKRHEKSHVAQEDRPHQCAVCGKRFAAASVLKEHGRIHEGVKPYICQVCGKAFTQNSHLKYHIKIHTEEKPYPCDMCDMAFRCAAAKRKHLKSHYNKTNTVPRINRNTDLLVPNNRNTDAKKVITRVMLPKENSAGLQAAKGLVAMAAGQGAGDRSNQIIILAPPGGGSEQQKYLLASGGQIVQHLTIQHQVQSTVTVHTNKTSAETAHTSTVNSNTNGAETTSKAHTSNVLYGGSSNVVGIAQPETKTENAENYQVIYVQAPQESQSIENVGAHVVTDGCYVNNSDMTPVSEQVEIVMETDNNFQPEEYQPSDEVGLRTGAR